MNITGTLDVLGPVASTPAAGGTSVTLTGSASALSYDVMPTEPLDLQAAQSLAVMPAPGACTAVGGGAPLSFAMTLVSASFDFEGFDVPPATDCADYAAALYASGVTVVLKKVPYQADDAMASQVTLKLSAP